MTRNLNVYYFKVQLEAQGDPEPDQIKAIISAFSFPEDKQYRPVLQSGGNVTIHGNRVKRNGVVLGSFSYIQLEEIPPKQNKLTNVIKSIDLDEDEGLGYYSPFLFDPSSRILAFVSTRNGVNLSAVKKFTEYNFDIPKFQLTPIIEPAVLQEFLNTPNYKSVKFKVAKVDKQAGLVPKDGKAVSEIIDVAEQYDPAELTYDLKAGRKGHLNTGMVRRLVEALFSYRGDEVKQLVVDGFDEDDIRRHFDFVTDRLRDTIVIETHRMGRYAMEEVYAQLEEKFLEHSQGLRKLYGKK